MNVYKLDDKAMDEAFLLGKPVLCRAVLSRRQQQEKVVKDGAMIVVELSTGRKYKGIVISFEHVIINGYAMGEISIVRST